MKYDYIIKNGTLFDFENRKTYCGDVYVKDGRIADASCDSDISYAKIIDAKGKYVLPGLIDEHAHWAWGIGSLSLNADQICPNSGVTTTVDAGSTGIENFESFYQMDIIRYKTDVRAYLHIATNGVLATSAHEEDQDPDAIDESKIFNLFKKYPECLRGLKVRLSQATMQYGLEPLERAICLANKLNAAGYRCVVAVHVANISADFPFEEMLNLMRPGDIYTHLYQNLGPTIFDSDGKIHECFKKARERGVIFSSGNGSLHWTLDNLKKGCDNAFFPDIISSDICSFNVYLRPGFNLLYTMHAWLLSGMDVIDVMKAVTLTPAKCLGLEEVGELKPGYKADITILDRMEKETVFVDRFGGKAVSKQIFVPVMTIKGGEVVHRQFYFDGGCDFPKIERNFL